MKVVISAIPGSGKTTILKLVKKEMPEIRIVSVGDMISKTARQKLNIQDRDSLRGRMTIEQQRTFQEEVSEEIAKMKDKDILIDTHTAVKIPKGFFPGLSEKTAKIIKPDIIVFLEYDPKDIIERRNADKSRRRDDDSEEEIEEHQDSAKRFAFTAAGIAESAVKILNFRYPQKKPMEHTEKAAKEIVKLFRDQSKA